MYLISAGVGRTGTLIALDILMEQARNKKIIDVMNTVVKNEEFSIAFDNRFIANIFAIQRNRPKGNSLDISKIIVPNYINKVPYVPDELEIIEIYNNIYSNQGSIQARLDIEERMFKNIVHKIKSIYM